MKRRDFFQQAGAAVAGGAAALANRTSLGAEAAAEVPAVLVTSAELELARSVAAGLAGRYRVQLTAVAHVATELPFVPCDLEAGEATEAVVRGMQAIVHVGPEGTPEDERALVDRWPRQTYHLLRAAANAGVKRVVYLSSLELVGGYDPQYLVDEDWQPLVLAGHLPQQLGEFCCREFAREKKMEVVALRLGRVLRGQDDRGPTGDDGWVDERDAVQAVERALAARTISDGRGIETWSVCHITSDPPSSRFPITRARRLLGYDPRFGGTG